MSMWNDEDGNQLGDWEPCTSEHYVDVMDNVLGDQLTVFSARTEMGDDNPVRNRHIHTEWGRKGDDAPMVRCENDIDSFGVRSHQDYRFVRTDGAS